MADVKSSPQSGDAQPPPAQEPPRAKSGGKPKVQWHSRMETGMRGFSDSVGILSQGMFSADGGTRRMSAIFFASCLLLILVLTAGGLWLRNQVDLSGADDQAQTIQGFLRKQIENADQAAAVMELGSFTIDLKSEQEGKSISGVVNLAEIAITVICDGRAACEFIRENFERTRDQITHVFVYTDRAELMSIEGKRRLKSSIIKRVNHILPDGKVVEVYFTKLLIS